MDTLHALTLADVVHEHARARPSETALVCGDDRWDWRTTDEQVRRLATVLSEHGVSTGDRVLWVGQNCHWVVGGMLACAELGAVLVPVNWRQSPDELAYVLDDADPKVVLWLEEEIAGTVATARERTSNTATWLQVDGAAELDRAVAAAQARPESDVDPAGPVLGLYTAAFEGHPRCALLSHSGLLHQALALAIIQGITPAYTYLNSGPLFHIATFMTTVSTLHLGGTNVFTRRSDAEEMCRLIQEERCNGAFLLYPTAQKIGEVNADGRYDLSSLVTMKMGVKGFDDAIAQESTAWIRKPGGYGQTEVTGLATYAAFGGSGVTGGRPSPVALVRVVDEDGREVAPGEVGEIVVRGPVVMTGYLGAEEETARRQRGGWHHTNDLGRREEDGSITFVGPRTVLIKTGAENVYPAEVEGCLVKHPAVREAAVIGVPDPTWGQNVTAIVVLHGGQTATAEDLIAHCKEHIASYKKPKDVVFVDALPRNASGMVDREALDAAHGGGGYPGTA